MNFISGNTIYFVKDIASVKIVDEKGQNIEGTTIQLDVEESRTFNIQLTFSGEGETPFDERYVEWFCVVSNTPTNNIKAIESAVDAGDVVELSTTTTNDNNQYSVTLNVKTRKVGKARIVGHVKKNPCSSMANNADHIYSFFDIEVSGPTSDTTDDTTSNPTGDKTSNPTGDQQIPASESFLEIETQVSSSSDSTQEKDQSTNGKSKKGISAGAIAGIVVGVLVILAAVGVGVFLYFRRAKIYQDSASDNNEPTPPA